MRINTIVGRRIAAVRSNGIQALVVESRDGTDLSALPFAILISLSGAAVFATYTWNRAAQPRSIRLTPPRVLR